MIKSPIIKSADHVKTGRLGVFRQPTGFWYVAEGELIKGHFPTHAEAITYATEHATRQALAAGFTIPPNPIAAALKEGA